MKIENTKLISGTKYLYPLKDICEEIFLLRKNQVAESIATFTKYGRRWFQCLLCLLTVNCPHTHYSSNRQRNNKPPLHVSPQSASNTTF